jgi:hypothetical protein
MSAFGDFGKWVPGFEFLKGLTQPSGAPGTSAMPSLGGWVAPTLNVEDLEQRIKELKTVLFWLEQNGTALKATIQAMEGAKDDAGHLERHEREHAGDGPGFFHTHA